MANVAVTKCRRRNLNVDPNIYSRESNFLFRGNSTVQFSHKKLNKQSKTDNLMKLTKNPVIIAHPCSHTFAF